MIEKMNVEMTRKIMMHEPIMIENNILLFYQYSFEALEIDDIHVFNVP